MQYRARSPHHSATASGGLENAAARIVSRQTFSVGAYGELIDFQMVRHGDVVTRLRARYVHPVHVALRKREPVNNNDNKSRSSFIDVIYIRCTGTDGPCRFRTKISCNRPAGRRRTSSGRCWRSSTTARKRLARRMPFS